MRIVLNCSEAEAVLEEWVIRNCGTSTECDQVDDLTCWFDVKRGKVVQAVITTNRQIKKKGEVTP